PTLSPETARPTANAPLSSPAGIDPRNWQSLVRVSSTAFLDGNTCWLVKVLPETIRPDGDVATVQAQIKQVQDWRRAPFTFLNATQGVTIPLQVTNIVKDGEAIALDPKMVVSVLVQQSVPEHINTISNCGGMGIGTYRDFSSVSLVQTASVEQYKV